SALSHAWTGDRDAVRVVGRPAVEVPGWRWQGSAVAEWDPSAVGWGPAYEPHRHPAGAGIGRRLPLPSGRYHLRLDGGGLDAASPPARLEARRDGASEGPSTTITRGAHGWEAVFDVAEGARPLTLFLHDGGAFVLKGISLEVQPSEATAGLNLVEGPGS